MFEGWRTSEVWAVVGSLREAAVFWMDHWRRRLRPGSFIVMVVWVVGCGLWVVGWLWLWLWEVSVIFGSTWVCRR